MKQVLFIGFAALLVALAAGCDVFEDDPASPAAEVAGEQGETIDLDSPTGGYTATDEEVAFGEAEAYEPYLNIDVAVDDETQNDPEVMRYENQWRHRALRFRLRAVWGKLPYLMDDPDTLDCDCLPVDWTGGMKLEGGIIVIERIIAFERNDHVERIDRSTIRWVSQTCPHVDGIQVRLIVPQPPVDSLTTNERPGGEAALTIRTGPFTRTFTLDELAALDLTQPVDRCNNYMSIQSHILPDYCPHGYLFGGWRDVEPDTIYSGGDSTEVRGIVLGRYRGMWIDERGHRAGYLRGVYGLNSDEKPVFYGKYIDLCGRFRGFIKGEYGMYREDTARLAADGWFHGVWTNRDHIVLGRLKGGWITRGTGKGYFHGVWGKDCSAYLD